VYTIFEVIGSLNAPLMVLDINKRTVELYGQYIIEAHYPLRLISGERSFFLNLIRKFY
jgi:hypothetical protein